MCFALTRRIGGRKLSIFEDLLYYGWNKGYNMCWIHKIKCSFVWKYSPPSFLQHFGRGTCCCFLSLLLYARFFKPYKCRIHFCKGILNEALDVLEIFLYSGFDSIQSIICIFDSELHFVPLFFLWKLICSTCQYGLRLLFISINNP